MRLQRSFLLLSILLGGLLSVTFNAVALEQPSEQVILKVKGNIKVTNTPTGSAEFDRPLLKKFKRTDILTMTPWTDGEIEFTGVLLRDLMEYLDATGTILHATAINDYAVEIPFEDFQKYDVIIAYEINNEAMSIRDKGPLWIIYPWDGHPSLKNELYHSRSIWQLTTLEAN